MTRIIGGIAGSRQLVSPAKSTRPTSDRIRESIFNRLESRDAIKNASVLDLYAGTGALALEAISRGAKEALLVEKDGKAAAVCIKNTQIVLQSLKNEGASADVRTANKTVSQILAGGGTFDLVFIDPPYDVPNSEITANLTALVPMLSDSAIVMLERSSRDQLAELPSELTLDDEKNYGDTNVYWISKK